VDAHPDEGNVIVQLTESRNDAEIYLTVGAEPCRRYSLEFWAKGAAGSGETGNVTARLQCLSATGTVLSTSTLTIHGGSLGRSSWTPYRIDTPPSPADTAKVEVSITASGQSASARIDDVILAVGDDDGGGGPDR
jgi:hypothetical protein